MTRDYIIAGIVVAALFVVVLIWADRDRWI